MWIMFTKDKTTAAYETCRRTSLGHGWFAITWFKNFYWKCIQKINFSQHSFLHFQAHICNPSLTKLSLKFAVASSYWLIQQVLAGQDYSKKKHRELKYEALPKNEVRLVCYCFLLSQYLWKRFCVILSNSFVVCTQVVQSFPLLFRILFVCLIYFGRNEWHTFLERLQAFF